MPGTFKIVHQGGKPEAYYCIGSLAAGGKDFRVYMLFKTEGGNKLIHQLRIDKEDVQ
ncbi:MAG: DUF4783 domain-containing protein [Bacteroidales bacterium]|nr:DUF4783 domain-containing protein [Bacteroidales bacterium]